MSSTGTEPVCALGDPAIERASQMPLHRHGAGPDEFYLCGPHEAMTDQVFNMNMQRAVDAAAREAQG